FAIVVVALVAGEIEDVLLQQRPRTFHALAHALAVGGEHRVGRLQLTAPDGIVEQELIAIEAGDIRRSEELLAAVQRLQVALVHPGRQRVVQRLWAVRVAAVGQQPVDQLRGSGLVLRRAGRQLGDRPLFRSLLRRLDGGGHAAADRRRQPVVGPRQQRQRGGQQERKQGGLGIHRRILGNGGRALRHSRRVAAGLDNRQCLKL